MRWSSVGKVVGSNPESVKKQKSSIASGTMPTNAVFGVDCVAQVKIDEQQRSERPSVIQTLKLYICYDVVLHQVHVRGTMKISLFTVLSDGWGE